MSLRILANRHPLATFVALTYGWSWTFWFGLRATLGPSPAGHAVPWIAILATGAIGPTLGAIATAALRGGRPSVSALLRRYLIWRVGFIWYLIALFLPGLIYLATVALYALSGHEVGGLRLVGPVAFLLPLVLALPAGPICEELGWRGYALPHLQQTRGALASSLIVGAIWFTWHAPLMWMSAGTLISGQPVTLHSLAIYLLWVEGAALLMTWVANNTQESVLLAMLMHAGWNAQQPLVLFPHLPDGAERAIGYASVLPVCLTAVAVVLIFGPARLVRTSRPSK